MSKRQTEHDEEPPSKSARITVDDDLNEDEIEIDHPRELTIAEREFADQFLVRQQEEEEELMQTLPEDYIEPARIDEWYQTLKEIDEQHEEEARRFLQEQEEEQEQDEIEEDEGIEEEEEEQEEEEEEEDEEEGGTNEQTANADGESTQDILDIVYGEHVIDPYASIPLNPTTIFLHG